MLRHRCGAVQALEGEGGVRVSSVYESLFLGCKHQSGNALTCKCI
jgi:hypothetical protein